MNSGDRKEFEEQLAVLCAGMDVPCTTERKEAYWRALQQMSLSVFVRTVDFVLSKEIWAKIPKPGQLWEASRRMRASGPPPAPKDDGYTGDIWDMAANRYLLGYLATQLAAKPHRYGRGASPKLMRAREEDIRQLGLDMKLLDASQEFIGTVQRLVAAKNAWAIDMRDLDRGQGVPPETQKAVWYDYLNRAEVGLT